MLSPLEKRARTSVANLASPTSDSAPSEARKRGSGGESPRKIDDWFSLRPSVTRLASPTSDSTPSEARKRGSGGGSPRKIDGWYSEGIVPSGPVEDYSFW